VEGRDGFPAAFTKTSRLITISCYYTASSHHETSPPTPNVFVFVSHASLLYSRPRRTHGRRHTVCTRSACLAVTHFHIELIPDPAFKPYVKLWVPSEALGRGGFRWTRRQRSAAICVSWRLPTVSLHLMAKLHFNEADGDIEMSEPSASAVNHKMRDMHWLQMDLSLWRKCEFYLPIAVDPADKCSDSIDSTFIDNDSTVTFYYRPQDHRARMLFSSFDSRGRESVHSVPLTSLTVVRDRSILTLLRARSHNGILKPWANLKFIHYERMILFYSTFVALKRQDLNETPEPLIDNPAEHQGEEEHYGGVIRDNGKLHALRLFECPGSGAFRLEARPYRGGREEVPIWTAFLTKYLEKSDPIFSLEDDKVTVIMAGLKPAPFMFVSGYMLPQTQDGDYVLRFDSRDGELDLCQAC